MAQFSVKIMRLTGSLLGENQQIGPKPAADLVNTGARCGEQPILHSDCGAHSRWPGWLERVNDAKLVRSMSRTARSQDTTACDGFFGRLKAEVFCLGIGGPSRLSRSSTRLMATVAGIPKQVSRCVLAAAAQSNTVTALAL